MLKKHLAVCVAVFGRPADFAHEMKVMKQPTGIIEYRWDGIPLRAMAKATDSVVDGYWRMKISDDRRTVQFSLRSHQECHLPSPLKYRPM